MGMRSSTRHLLPLFISDFFAGLMFYFSIVFPFMHHLGFTTAQLSLYIVVSNIVVLAIEVPSGILADRWSRKGVVMLGLACIGAGSLVFGISQSLWDFLVADTLASAYFAIRTGMPEAMIYDSLLEAGHREEYESQLGRLRLVNSTGLASSSLIGAVVASGGHFRIPFFMSTVSCVMAIIWLARFKEPSLHKQAGSVKLVAHITDLFRSVAREPGIRLLVITGIFVGIEFNYMVQADPFWPLALGLGTAWFGPLNASLMASIGLGGALAGRITHKLSSIYFVGLGMLLGAAGLLVHNIYIVALSEFLLLATASCLIVVLSGRIQDRLPSSQRSGVESAVSTLGCLAFLASMMLFTPVAQEQGVFRAAWILVAVALCAVGGLKVSLKARRG